MSREGDIEKFYHRLALNLRSAASRPNDGDDCKCLVRFNNCTAYNVQPFWIDPRGRPIEYRPIPRGDSLNMDTYESHLWFFKALGGIGERSDEARGLIKLLAIPEEIIDMKSGLSSLESCFRDPSPGAPEAVNGGLDIREATFGQNNLLICPLCKYVVKSYSKVPVKVPCPHLTGAAKFSVSDMICRSWSRSNPAYIYSCTSENHRRGHSERRRNIYLVEPFHNLRERCFLALRNHRHSDLAETNLPTSLLEDYIHFMTTLMKVNDS